MDKKEASINITVDISSPRLDEMNIDDDKIAFKATKKRIKNWVIEAWEKLAPTSIPIEHLTVDVVAEGLCPQMTPMLCSRGVVIRLDLSANCEFPSAEEDDEHRRRALEYIKTLVFHEMYHLADRLDPDFALDCYEDAVRRGDKRESLNAVWDIYIERRKLRRQSLLPFSFFKTGTEYSSCPQKAVLCNLKSLMCNEELAEKIFREIWDTNNDFSYKKFTELADEIVSKNAWRKERVGADGKCQLNSKIKHLVPSRRRKLRSNRIIFSESET